MTGETVSTANEIATGFSLPRHPRDSPPTPPVDLRIAGGVGSDLNRVTVGGALARMNWVGEVCATGTYPTTSHSPTPATQRGMAGGAYRG